jgi:hypothetical protein
LEGGVVIRHNLYLQKNDEDIMILLQSQKLAQLVRKVVRAEIEGTEATIPLPPLPTNLKMSRSVTLRLDDTKDADVIMWLKQIKAGYVSGVIKLLIRRSMEKTDIRAFMMDYAPLIMQDNALKKATHKRQKLVTTQKKEEKVKLITEPVIAGQKKKSPLDII